jgi:hypothetical protein
VSNGKGCRCNAHCEHECCCDADWTTKEVYDLRADLARVTAERDEARREVCHYKFRSIMDDFPDADTAPQVIAENRGWDCFEEDGK